MRFVAFPIALNHVESKWARAIPARVLAQKDPSTGGIGEDAPLLTHVRRALLYNLIPCGRLI